MRKKCLGFAVVLLAIAFIPDSAAQQRNQATLRQLNARAGYIFVGRVKSVQYLPARTPSQVASVKISFQVEQGLRGARSGRVFTFREWAGVWETGERYKPGERLLLFLYPASKLGLTSSVGGGRGRLVLDRNGQVLLGAERTALWRDSLPEIRRDRLPLREFIRGLRGLEEE